MTVCKSCGKAFQENAKFCPYCGTAAKMKDPQQLVGASDTESQLDRDQRRRNLLIAAIVLTGVAVIVFTLVLPSIRNQNYKSRSEALVNRENPVYVQRDAEPSPPSWEEIKSTLISKTRMYYQSLGSDSFDASDFYAPSVSKYFTKVNLNPAAINDIYYKGFFQEFQDPDFRIDESSIRMIKTGTGYILQYQGEFTCYRKSKRKYEYAQVKTVLSYDSSYRIVSIYEADIWNIKFTEQRIAI